MSYQSSTPRIRRRCREFGIRGAAAVKSALSRSLLMTALTGRAGAAAAVKSALSRRPVTFRFTPKGCRHPLRMRAPSSDAAAYVQVFMIKHYDFKAANPPKVIIDAGANIGLAAVYFAGKYPEAKILALEPEDKNYALLAENAAPYANITPIHAALWHKNEKIYLADPHRGEWGFTVSDRQHAPADADICGEVTGVTVDKIMADYRLSGIDILKIDIEGAEKEIFECEDTPWIDKTEAIIVEPHDRLKPGCSAALHGNKNMSGFAHQRPFGENILFSRGI